MWSQTYATEIGRVCTRYNTLLRRYVPGTRHEGSTAVDNAMPYHAGYDRHDIHILFEERKRKKTNETNSKKRTHRKKKKKKLSCFPAGDGAGT